MMEYLPMLPLLVLTLGILTQMLAIAFWRNIYLTLTVSVLMLVFTFIGYIYLLSQIPMKVTPLIQFDGIAIYFSLLILLTAFVITVISYDYFKVMEQQQEEFYMLLNLATLGALVLVCSSHFASFILGLELLGVSLYTMISYPEKGLLTLEAALKYLILSGVSSAFILFGTALIYAIGGTLGFEELAALRNIATGGGQLILLSGSALIFAGLMFKLSLVPFHMWTPDVYQGAPAPVTAYVATISKGAIFVVMFRIFASSQLVSQQSILVALTIVAVFSMVIGNLLALKQNNVKRILAYSSIAHLGYLMVAYIAAGVVGGASLAMEASSFFLAAYVLSTLLAFTVVSVVSVPGAKGDTSMVEDYQGLFWRRPMLAVMFTAALLSLAGIPLTIGFIGKFYVFSMGVGSSLWVLLAAMVIGSGIGLYYYLRIVFVMTQSVTGKASLSIPTASGWMLIMMISALILLGVYPAPLMNFITHVAIPTM